MAEWFVTTHAGEQMIERDIQRDALLAMLDRPDKTIPDPKRQPQCRYFIGRGLLAVVNVDTHEVITVGYDGATRHDWMTWTAPETEARPTPCARRTRRRREKPEAPPVTVRSVLDGVDPGVAATVRATLAKLGLDFRAVRVTSPTQVEILPNALPSASFPPW